MHRLLFLFVPLVFTVSAAPPAVGQVPVPAFQIHGGHLPSESRAAARHRLAEMLSAAHQCGG
ncbi:MAG TPA: hypothetical protein PLL44_03930 [Novosphingobium sp.]|jgi:hypothetical protein|nr:hypothetical protein [Novosphingobium sp.]HQQ08498.1 hypothetical protein [Novosphingobium sp.]